MKILIGGLLPGHHKHIDAVCPPGTELSYITVEASMNQWKAKCKHYDYCIAMVDFVSHKHTAVLHQNAHGKVIELRGGMTRLKELVRSLK